jgi:opacity protein-like surface antigen
MKRALLGLALAAILPVSAQAADNTSSLSYSYIEATYQNSDWFSENFDGFGVAGSIDFSHDWYGSASYRSVGNGDFDLDLDETVVNLGWHHAVSDKADFLAELGYVNYGADAGGGIDGDSDGYRVAAGFRGMMAPRFEGSIKASYTDISDMDGEFGVGVGAVFHINQTWGITGSYEHTNVLDEGMDTWGLGVRASF